MPVAATPKSTSRRDGTSPSDRAVRPTREARRSLQSTTPTTGPGRIEIAAPMVIVPIRTRNNRSVWRTEGTSPSDRCAHTEEGGDTH